MSQTIHEVLDQVLADMRPTDSAADLLGMMAAKGICIRWQHERCDPSIKAVLEEISRERELCPVTSEYVPTRASCLAAETLNDLATLPCSIPCRGSGRATGSGAKYESKINP